VSNIVHVQYLRSNNLGELKAIWFHAEYRQGTGLAIGGLTQEFERKYLIKYFDSAG